MSDLRPMALGEIVDRSVSLWREHWAPLFRLYLGFQLVQYLMLKLWQLSLRTWFPAALVSSRMVEDVKSDPGGTAVRLLASTGAILLMTLYFAQVQGLAMSAFVYPRHTGLGAPTATESLKAGLSRLGVTTLAFALSLGWSGLAALFFQVPAAVAGGLGALALSRQASAASIALFVVAVVLVTVGLVVALLWFVIRFFCLSQVAALEPVSAWTVFRRTDALSSGRVEPGLFGLVKVRLTVLITVVGLILSVIYVVTGIPSAVLHASYGNILDPTHADQTAIPAALLIPAELGQIIVSSLVAPVYAVFAVVFYVDMRVRREGLDLSLGLGKSAP